MFPSRSDPAMVTCIACGQTVQRSDAREYDKYGDRWDRADKEFEYLCKTCFGDMCRLPRRGLETHLRDAGAGETDREEFLARFRDLNERPSSERE